MNDWEKWKIFLIAEKVNCAETSRIALISAEKKISFTFKFHLHIIYSAFIQQTFTEHLSAGCHNYKICCYVDPDCPQVPSSCFSPSSLYTQLSHFLAIVCGSKTDVWAAKNSTFSFPPTPMP